jgi:branched-chain amino acid transport system substrate-binding protein
MNGLRLTRIVQGHKCLSGKRPIETSLRRALESLLGLLVLIALTGCATLSERTSGGKPSESRVIRIATQSPLSGPQAVLGEAIKLGAQLAIEKLKGPVEGAGFSVELVPFDDQAKPDVGVVNAKKIMTDPDILLVIGHLNSGVAIPSSELYRQVDLAMISPANTNPRVTDRGYPNVNRVIGRDDAQGTVGAEFAQGELRAGSVFVIHDRTRYGQGVAEFFRSHAERSGIRVLGFWGTEERQGFASLISEIKAKDPDVVYFSGIYDQAGVFFKQAREASIRAAFLGPDGMDSSDLAKIAGQSVVGLHYTTTGGPVNVYPGAREFARKFRRRFGKFAEPYAAEAYNATMVGLKALELAIQEAGGRKPTRQQVSATIRQLPEIQGVTGPISFDEKGDRMRARYHVIRVVSANPALWGQNRLVKTIEVPPPPLRK